MKLNTLAVVLAVALPSSALAFDWNAETGFFQWLFGRQGYFAPKSGHTLATACAFDEVSKKAAADPRLKAALEDALSTGVPAGLDQIQYSVPYQLVVFGNWGNEIFTNSSLEGRASHEDAGEFLRGRYHKWLSSSAKDVYLSAKDSEGYSGTYYLHSQAIDGKTQDQSFDAIEKHVKTALAASITSLREADKKGQALPSFSGAFKGLAPGDCNERCRGIAFMGTVFHLLEDSSVSCSAAAQAELAAKGLPSCVKGDGHTIVDWTPSGRPQVVTLSNDEFYQGRGDVHGNLDGTYTSCDAKAFQHTKDGRTFDMNPKYVNSEILAAVALAVKSGETPEAAARRIYDEVVASRFAKKEDRQPMPPTAAPTVSSRGRRIAEFGEWLSERSWQPLTNKAWYGLGRFVAWVDHKFGDADGWSEGVSTAWGTTGGSNVSRFANTRPAGTTTAAGAGSRETTAGTKR